MNSQDSSQGGRTRLQETTPNLVTKTSSQHPGDCPQHPGVRSIARNKHSISDHMNRARMKSKRSIANDIDSRRSYEVRTVSL